MLASLLIALIEWVWGLRVKPDRSIRNTISVTSKKEFREYCLQRSPEIETIQCICEGAKHLGTSGKNVEATSLKCGAFNAGFDKGFDISRFQVDKTDGDTSYFDNELETVVAFWDSFFASHLSP